MELHPYQREAVESVLGEWPAVRSTLLVMSTGTGKTVTASEILRRRREHGRVLWVAHREELIDQAAASLGQHGNLSVEVEKGDRFASTMGFSDVVVASVQSLHARRRKRFPADAFSTIVIDEAHRSAARTYREIIGRFQSAKVLGLTATPDRGDGVGLGGIYDSVAYTFDIRDAIRGGWLVPIRSVQVECADLDVSHVKTSKGDLAQGELNQVMGVDKVLHQVAKPLVAEAEDRQTIVFCAGVEQAKAFVDVMARYYVDPSLVASVDGSTDGTLRRQQLDRFRAGELQFLVNVGVFTEGTDLPMASCIAVARPTKSRALYCQMVGRGTRLHPGKSDCLVLNYTGNTGTHSLVTPLDVLGGRELPAQTRKRAERKASEGKDLLEAIREAQTEEEEAEKRRKEEEARRRRGRSHAVVDVPYSVREVDPFAVYGGERGPRATDPQLNALKRIGFEIKKRPSKGEASRLLDQTRRRREAGLVTSVKMRRKLSEHGLSDDIPHDEAKKIMAGLKANRWKRPPQWAVQKYRAQPEAAE